MEISGVKPAAHQPPSPQVQQPPATTEGGVADGTSSVPSEPMGGETSILSTSSGKPKPTKPSNTTAAESSTTSTARKGRLTYKDIHWKESTLEREKTGNTCSTDIMSFYVEHLHKPRPVKKAGFKRPNSTPKLVLSSLVQEIFPKYPLPLNFLELQRHQIFLHPPMLRKPNVDYNSQTYTATSRAEDSEYSENE